MRVTQSQNVPLSCLSRPLADRLAEAAYRDILGLSYARAFSAAWSNARLWIHIQKQIAGFFEDLVDSYTEAICRFF